MIGKERERSRQSILVVATGEGSGGGMDWEFGLTDANWYI